MTRHLWPAAAVGGKVLYGSVADESTALFCRTAAAATPILATFGRATLLFARGALAMFLHKLMDGLGPFRDEFFLAEILGMGSRGRRLAPATLLSTRCDGARGMRLFYLVGERGLNGVRGKALPKAGVSGRASGCGAEGVSGGGSGGHPL